MKFSIVTAIQTFSLHEKRIIKDGLRLKCTLSPCTLARECDMQHELMPVRSSHLEKLRGTMYVLQNKLAFSFFFAKKLLNLILPHAYIVHFFLAIMMTRGLF